MSFVVSRIASMATLAPKAAAVLAKKALRYLVATSTIGIDYLGGPEATNV